MTSRPKLTRTRDGHSILLRCGSGQRSRFTIKLADEQAAQRRGVALQELAAMLARSGRPAEFKVILRRAAEVQSDADYKKILTVAESLVGADAKKPKAVTTFGEMAHAWTSGELHRQFPDHVRDIGHDANAILLKNYLLPVLGDLPLEAVRPNHCDDVMRRLPAHLSKNSRCHVAKVVNRVLNLAEFAGELERNPLPKAGSPHLA